MAQPRFRPAILASDHGANRLAQSDEALIGNSELTFGINVYRTGPPLDAPDPRLEPPEIGARFS